MATPEADAALNAILIPPQLERFRQITGLGAAPLAADFSGWHKHVILAPDRVFLFPRHEAQVAIIEREAAVYAALSPLSLALPHLLARYRDDEVSPYPFIAVSRLAGVPYATLESALTLAEVEQFLGNLGRLIASWHNLAVATLPPILHEQLPGWHNLKSWRDAALSPKLYPAGVLELHILLGRNIELLSQYVPDLRSRLGDLSRLLHTWDNALGELAALEPVLAHRDIHEGQLLVVGRDDLAISGVLDWETAGIDNPMLDFDFGEWGYGIWAWVGEFVRLRRTMWAAYGVVRQADLPHWSRVHLYFCMREAMGLLDGLLRGGAATPAVMGTPAEVLLRLIEATALCAGH